MTKQQISEPSTVEAIHALIRSCGADPTTFASALVTEMIQNSMKLLFDTHHEGQIKLMNRALKEIRYAFNIFNAYADTPCVSIFGSARTAEDHPDYLLARSFAAAIASNGWMVITGAANGIMKAGLEGASRASSFGLCILLPNEPGSNSVIHGDLKLMHFRYFFTRKLLFMSQSRAFAAFPGGVGTQDELFECLTLMQTGKTPLLPIVLLEAAGGTYWEHWENYLNVNLFQRGLVSACDRSLYYRAPSLEAGVAHILRFYHRYHSSRYVNDNLVIRLKTPLSITQVDQLNQQFYVLVKEGCIAPCAPFAEEHEYLDLPRITFVHTRTDYSILRQMIDVINNFPQEA